MMTIKITELGNNKILLILFNENMQTIKSIRGQKHNKQLLVSRLRKPLMKEGKSIFCDDQTVPVIPWSD